MRLCGIGCRCRLLLRDWFGLWGIFLLEVLEHRSGNNEGNTVLVPILPQMRLLLWVGKEAALD